MPIISTRIIKKSQKDRYCSNCNHRINGEAIRFFGMAEHGDPPYMIYLHRNCILDQDALSKIRAVEHRNGADTGQDTDKKVSADV